MRRSIMVFGCTLEDGSRITCVSMANKRDPLLANKSDPPGTNFLVI